jgi:hypothetical protein
MQDHLNDLLCAVEQVNFRVLRNTRRTVQKMRATPPKNRQGRGKREEAQL